MAASPVTMPQYYRAFEEMINPLLDAGFALRRVVDSKPIEALRTKDPVAVERFTRMPPCMCLDAVKR